MARNKFDVDEKLEAPFNAGHLKRALKYVYKSRWWMVLALFLAALNNVVSLFGPKMTQKALDTATAEEVVPNAISIILWAGIVYLGIIIVTIIISTIRARIMANVSQRLVYDIRQDLFDHLQELPFSYYDSRPAGKILVRVINYVNAVSDMLTNGLISIVLDFIDLAFVVVFMFTTNVKLTWVIIATGLPLYVLFMMVIRPLQRKIWQQQSNKGSNYNAYLAESIDGVRVTQLFTRQEENIGIMGKLIAACRKVAIKASYLSHTNWFVSDLISQIVYSALYIAGVYWVGGGEAAAIASFGVVTAMGQYIGRFWQPIANLGAVYNQFINGIAYLERIFETMDEPIVVDDKPDAYELPPIKGDVSFRNVCFGYDPGIPVLQNVNFEVKAGESVAFVGQTGAGKTTIVNLLSRFYNIDDGAVLIDGQHNVADVTLRSLRGQMGVMLQDTFIFSGSILDNIRYGRLDATMEEVEAAAKAVCAHDFIMAMPKGYYTEVNERGSCLSQGQRQLISFARTLLSNPRILILDEATSSIDTQTERLLQQGIAALLKNRTSFLIAHRLSTIKNCDKIMYIGEKHVMECGSHDELMALHGHYYQLYTAQARDQGVLDIPEN